MQVSAAAEQLGADHAQLAESQRILDETLDREAERTVLAWPDHVVHLVKYDKIVAMYHQIVQ